MQARRRDVARATIPGMDRDRRHALGTLSVVVAACMFAGLGSVSRLAEERAGIDTIAFVAWRSFLGAVVVGGLVAIRSARGRRLVGLRGLSGRTRGSLVVAVLAGIVLNLAIFVAFSRIAVALALLAFYTYPALVAAAVVVLERRRPDRYELAALAMALTGMTVVVLGGIEPGVGLVGDPLGLGLALLAAAAQTVFILVGRHGFAEIPTDVAAFAVLGGGFGGFVVVAVLVGSVGPLIRPLGDPAAWPYFVLGGILGAGIPTTLYLLAIRWIGGVRTGILALIEPVVGAVIAAALLGQTLRPVQLLGGGFVLGAALLLQRAGPAGAEAAVPIGHDDGTELEIAPIV